MLLNLIGKSLVLQQVKMILINHVNNLYSL